MKPSTRRVLEALERAGRRGCLTHDLMQPAIGGERFSARIGELREAGYKIKSTYERHGSYRYRLVGHPNPAAPEIDPPDPPTGEWRWHLCWACAFGLEHQEHVMGALVIADHEPFELAAAA